MYLLSRVVPVACVHPPLPADHVTLRILGNILNTLSGLATMKEARDRAQAVPSFAACLSASLMLTQSAKVMQHALDTVARLAVSNVLQARAAGSLLLNFN